MPEPATAIRVPMLPMPDFNPAEPLDVRFGGFTEAAFDVLEVLRAHPYVTMYQREKDRIRDAVMTPFKAYRDDLVVNWILPGEVPLETERNVFSRLLKNDFGAGGCHHHLWMSFYRPGYRRLTDVQLVHTLHPEGFTVSLYLGAHLGAVFSAVARRVAENPEAFRTLIRPLLQYKTLLDRGKGKEEVEEGTLEPLPELFRKCRTFRVEHTFAREQVLVWKGDLVPHVLEVIRDFWPLYRWLLDASSVPHEPEGG